MARFVLASMLVLLTALLGGVPLTTERVVAACTPSVALAISEGARAGSETLAATVTVTASASTGAGADVLRGITFTSAQNGEVRVQGQPVTLPRTFALADVTSWSFEVRKIQPGLATTVFFTATDHCGDVPKFVGFGTGTASASTPTTATSTPTATPDPTLPRVQFGLGPEADGALASSLTASAPLTMLTSWYNSPSDLAWMTGWRHDLVPQAYAQGYALHLIVYSGDAEGPLSTAYGPACGRAYPLSSRFAGDMAQLAQTFAGSGPLYVTLFTEFQTYPCTDNAWLGSESYYRALKDQYAAALAAFRQHAPNARVSLGWGGWQARWDDPARGGGRSLFPYFADLLASSDFQSFQAMQSDSNVEDVRAMTQILGAYGPVMLAHYKPDNGSCAVATADLTAMLTASYLSELQANGLFAWSFMDDAIVTCSPHVNSMIRSAITTYGQ